MKFRNLIVAMAIFSAHTLSYANSCGVAVLKTYMPFGPGRPICQGQNFPAQFAGNMNNFFSDLTSRGYVPSLYDQCRGGESEDVDYYIVSQLGNCQQTGFVMSCSLYVALHDAVTNKVIYENSIHDTNLVTVTLNLGDAIKNLPACDKL